MIVVVLVAAVTTACSRAHENVEVIMGPPLVADDMPEERTDDRGPDTEGRDEITDEPSGPAGGNEGGTTETHSSGEKPTTAPDFPEDTREYAEAVVAAYGQWDLDRLYELTTPLAAEKLMKLPDQPLWEWTWIRCYAVDGCSFYNEDGDHLTLFIDPNQLGEAHAANDIAFTTTTYPDGALDYVEEFISAWHAGNLARMQLLAHPDAVAVYQQFESGPLLSHAITGGSLGGLTIVIVLTPGTEIEAHVGDVLLGGPQAIIGAYPEI